ncbi:hypothetical protein ARALYDRAFT_346595 [Arabidopsis lyrata subsp. lyrata]|uniref:Uncharacterized protein n=1 Tax=Arabidopsis lyrata subsp. lyrata TaxID=81972 RepID=D7LHE6_ARALL|nr:hypothetical protein ARALYDRAFT_346595 [Arabidopsis lyrata subsp. lyrata]
MEVAVEDESNGAARYENSKAEETEKAIACFSEAAAKIDPSDLAAFLEQLLDKFWSLPEDQVLRFINYFEIKISQESFPWVNMFKESPLSTLIHFPLSHISTSVDWINKLPFLTLRAFLLWACKSLADAKPTYQFLLKKFFNYKNGGRPPKVIYLLACILLISILSNPEARTILVNRAIRDGERLIPPSSFEILVRLTFPPSSARVKVTKRFEKVYPLLKEVALALESGTEGNAVEQIFTFSLKVAGEAKETAAIAIWSVTENVDYFKRWEILYKEHLEASVALLRKLVDE